MSSAAERVRVQLGLRRESDPAVRALEIALEALERHRPYGIYDECGHDHADGDAGTMVVEDVGTVCEEGRVSTVCYACHTTDGELCGECEDWNGEWPCPEFKAIERMADVLEGKDGKK